ncbi:MAG: phosphopantothenate--cysteine ligase [Defluviitaleaceae bacterium]|nr:phosphopantothenate--cysteine ligase [Defluviitaleaceae bacterium]MCL2835737.1 phosphopantothenate--cysteine ligase [Defluviitaleaceae bacterium]
MKILVTAGGTSEKIDEIRKISNISTGRLGALIADAFIRKANADITFVCGENSVIPLGMPVKIIKVGSVNELTYALASCFKQSRFDAVIHSMAVSDYSVRGTVSADDLSSAIAETAVKKFSNELNDMKAIIYSAIQQSMKNASEHKKISSDIENLVIYMEKTPKVINMIKRMQPETILVGFKLLASAGADKLFDTGHELLVKSDCDFVFANDLDDIEGDKHEGILIEPDRSYQRLYSKQDIARVIADKVLEKAGA